MKIKPVVFDSIQTKHTSFEVDFQLENNITFICGESGTGKSAVYSFLEELAADNGKIRCFNYLSQKTGYKTTISNSKGKLFVIDNADILLDDKKRSEIALDGSNQYIIIGRNPTGLMLSRDELFELESSTKNGRTLFTLKKSFS